MNQDSLNHLIEYYLDQGAPGDQQMLLALLREAQGEDGGILSNATLCAIAQACHVKESLLTALIRRSPSLRLEDAPHRLEVCGTCPKSTALRAYIEEAFSVRSGGISREGQFLYRVTGCMKNCRQGPSVRWDGTLYSGATPGLIDRLLRSDHAEHS